MNWITVVSYSGISSVPYDLDFPCVDTGYFSYDNNGMRFKKSFDGGYTWLDTQNTGPDNMCFINGQKGYGFNGSFFKRFENDSFYVAATLPYYLYNPIVAFTENKIGYSIFSDTYSGARRKVIRTLDDGNNWSLTLSDSLEVFYDIQVPSDSVCYISCTEGKIYKTENAGFSWTLINTGVNYTLKSMSFIDESTGWVITNNASLYKTTNGGISWEQQTLPIDNMYLTLKQIKMLDEFTGYIHGLDYLPPFGLYDIIFKTENGGVLNVYEKEGVNFELFPNPILKGKSITISLPKSENQVNIQLFSNSGKLVLEKTISNNINSNFQLPLHKIEVGIYYLKLNTENRTFTRKMVIQ